MGQGANASGVGAAATGTRQRVRRVASRRAERTLMPDLAAARFWMVFAIVHAGGPRKCCA